MLKSDTVWALGITLNNFLKCREIFTALSKNYQTACAILGLAGL